MLMLALPVFSFALLWAIFHQQVPSELPVAVLDADHSALSRRLVRMIDATRTMRVAYEISNLDQGEDLIRQGKAYALLVVPVNLDRDVRRGTGPKVVCHFNAQFLLPASIIRRDVRAVVGTLSAGIEVRMRESRGESPSAALDHVEPIRVERHTLFNPELSYVTFLLTALLPTMLQIFVLMTAVLAFGSELRDGTAREWIDLSGGGIVRAAVGKLLPHSIHFSLLGLGMLACLFVVVRIPPKGSVPLVVLATVLFVMAVQAVGALLVTIFMNLRMASSAAAFFSGPAFAFCGITFPTIAMPLLGRAWGALIPLTHYLRLLQEQAIRGATAASSLDEICILAAFAVVLPALSLWRLGVLARDERFWRRA
jgi:ABC-2 type transport system permease protein